MIVEARDAFDNPSNVGSDVTIDLESTSVGGTFSLLGGGSFSPVVTVTMSTGTSSVSFYYRDTNAGTPTVTGQDSGELWTIASQQQTVNAGPPSALEILPADGEWCGLTFTEDLERVKSIISSLVDKGCYPKELWA